MGRSQSPLPSLAGVDVEVGYTISRLERGSAMPSLARMERIAGALGVDLPELFRFRERETPKDKAIERLVSVVRRRSAEDIEVVSDVAARMFVRWK